MPKANSFFCEPVISWYVESYRKIQQVAHASRCRPITVRGDDSKSVGQSVGRSAGWPVCRLADDAWYGMQGLMFDIHNLAWTLKCWTSGSFFPKMWSSQEAEVPLAKAFFQYLRA